MKELEINIDKITNQNSIRKICNTILDEFERRIEKENLYN
jgi:hypothetical protein